MRILMLSDAETGGGAAIAASRLATALAAEGHTIHRVVLQPDGKEHAWKTHVLSPQLSLPARIVARALPDRRASLLSGACRRDLVRLLQEIPPDVINVHNIHSALDAGWSLELVETCCGSAPVVWTLHDMWSFTGRCAYSYDCTKFIEGCDALCPTPGEYPKLEPSKIHGAWEARKSLLGRHRGLAAVCPSRWLSLEAQKGFWQGRRVVVIPYGVPVETYEPLDRDTARKALGLTAKGPVLLAAAQGFEDRRKGGDLLNSALRLVTRKPLTLVTMGARPFPFEGGGVHVHHLGFVDYERTRSLAYNAADMLVHPALADNLPNVLLEAIACGTPVAAFQTGGVPDAVRENVSGWLARDLTAECLAETINRAIDSVSAEHWRTTCRALAESEYTEQRQAREYVALFRELLDQRSKG